MPRAKVIVCTDGGSRAGGRALQAAAGPGPGPVQDPPAAVVVFDRGLAPFEPVAGRDLDYATLRARHQGARVPVAWLESSEPSYILYVRHDRQAQGRAARHRRLCRGAGFFHGVPVQRQAGRHVLLHQRHRLGGGALVHHLWPADRRAGPILYEGTPVRPDGAILWKLVEKYRVNTLFSAPTAVRVLKRQDPALLKKHDLSSLRAVYLAGEPLDEPTAQWISQGWASPSSTTTGRPNRAGRSYRPSPAWKACRRVSAVPRSRCMALTPASSARPPARISVLTRRAWSPSCRPCRRARCPRSGATTSASSRPISRPSPAAWLFDLRLGAGGRGRLLVHPGPHRRRHQRGRPSPGHARDRGIRQQPRGHRRVRRGRRGRRAQGQVAMAFAVLKNPPAPRRRRARGAEGDIMRLVEDQLGPWRSRPGSGSWARCPRPGRARCCGARSSPCARDAIPET